MEKNVTTVKILDSSYKIACPLEEADAVKEAAVFLDDRLREIKKSSDLDDKKTAILTALNITNEYLKSLSNPQIKSLDSPALDDLTKAVENQLKSLSL
tara:strand:- start:25 stop:318 length:294 start_codon:yes stop_codon:yes gene_type:complete